MQRPSSTAALLLLALSSCAATSSDDEIASVDALRASLSFCATYDAGVDADLARGDARLFTAPSYRQQSEAAAGLGAPGVVLAPDAGRSGGALHFQAQNRTALFYSAEGNVPTDGASLDCTFSFWLKLDPDLDLEPGFFDPIQVTDKSYDDGAVWVDFTKDETPRRFRMGVFGDKEVWNAEGLETKDHPDYEPRLVAVEEPPFTREQWTQVTVTVDTGEGYARLYLNGELQGTSTRIAEAFTWDMERAAVRIGLYYVGYFDELMVFDRALDAAEVRALHGARPAELMAAVR
ncbi:MAG: LamG-like jellyroll fold domain-containing protein [Planctomycetota bacterium]